MTSFREWIPKARPAEAKEEELSGPALRVLPLVDGRTSIEQLSARVGMGMDELFTAFLWLVGQGVVDVQGAPSELQRIARMHLSEPPPKRSFQDETPLENEGDFEPDAEEPFGEIDEYGSEAAQSNLRKYFEAALHPLPRDVRIARATIATGDELAAWCFDPEPGIIQAVLENSSSNLSHARLIAQHHRNPIGLDAVGSRTQYAHDTQVRRLLLRNSQASERLLFRVVSSLTLTLTFRANMGHDLTERARKVLRSQLRQGFERASSEEKVALLLQTEGRCLPLLPGQTFDQKTTALLCRRTYQSSMLIQSLARFPACPPALLSHLLRQPVVLRNAHLKLQIQQHKNCPKLAWR
jgi:hypothetical protein